MDGISTVNPSALPDGWVDRIFERMEGLYGSLFLDRWKDCDLQRIKSTWAHELALYAQRPGAIAHALRLLSYRPLPPTLPEFLLLCQGAPREEAPMLPEPEIDKATQAARANEISEDVKRILATDPLGWARNPRSTFAWKLLIDGAAAQNPQLAALLGRHLEEENVPTAFVSAAQNAVNPVHLQS